MSNVRLSINYYYFTFGIFLLEVAWTQVLSFIYKRSFMKILSSRQVTLMHSTSTLISHPIIWFHTNNTSFRLLLDRQTCKQTRNLPLPPRLRFQSRGFVQQLNDNLNDVDSNARASHHSTHSYINVVFWTLNRTTFWRFFCPWNRRFFKLLTTYPSIIIALCAVDQIRIETHSTQLSIENRIPYSSP